MTNCVHCQGIATDGCVYASLEYKNDVIGKGVRAEIGVEGDFEDEAFYIAKITPGNDSSDGVWADKKHFAHTGNANFGIQNLEYAPHTGCLLAAVYPGESEKYPNRHMYFIDFSAPEYEKDGKEYLPLAKRGLPHESGVYGSDFPHGAYGLISLGDGYYYFAEHGWKDGAFWA